MCYSKFVNDEKVKHYNFRSCYQPHTWILSETFVTVMGKIAHRTIFYVRAVAAPSSNTISRIQNSTEPFPFNSTRGRPPIFWPSELSFLWSEQWHLTCAQTCASIKLGEPAMQTSNSYVIIYIHYLYTKCRQEGTRNQLASWFLVPLDEKCFFRTCVFGTFLCASSRAVNSGRRG